MILRALFGIGMGGEWGVGASLAMEKVPPKLRGVLSGLLQEGYAAGYLLATVCYFFVFPRWGWRPLFFIAGYRPCSRYSFASRSRNQKSGKKTRHESWGQLGGLLLHMEAFHLSDPVNDDDELCFSRNSGHVSNISRASVGLWSATENLDYRRVDGGGDLRRSRFRIHIGSLGTPPVDDNCVGVRDCGGSAVGVCSVAGASGRRRVPASVHGSGSLGIIPAHLSELSPDSVRVSCRALLISVACSWPVRCLH